MSPADATNTCQERSSNPVQALLAEVNALAAELRKPIAVAGRDTSLAAGERGILQALGEHGPQTVPGIARARGTSRQSVQMLVNRLKGQGWVELNANPAHKRSALVRLTPEGRALLEEVRVGQAVVLEARLGRLSETEVSRACELLGQVRQALAEAAPVQEGAVESSRQSGGRARGLRGGVLRQASTSADVPITTGGVNDPIPAHVPSPDSASAADLARSAAGEAEAEEFPVSLL